MFSTPLSPSTKANEKKNLFQVNSVEDYPCFSLNFDFLERVKKPLSLASTRKRRSNAEEMATTSQEKDASTSSNADEEAVSVVTYTEEELAAFKENMASENTKKSTNTSVRRLQSWYVEKHKTELDLNKISAAEAPQLLKHFFIEIRQTKKDSKGKEYEPGSLQTYRNGLRRYFLERQCPPAPDNFDIEKFEEVSTMLSVKKKDLKKKGFGNKPNAAQPLEDAEVEKLWSSGGIGLHNPRSLFHLVWWNNVTHLGMRAFKEQYDCQLEDFTITEQYIEYKERQTKNRQGDEGSAAKRARKYNNKIWQTDGGERDPYRAFTEYVAHRPKGDKVPRNFFLTPVDNPTSDVWYKMVPVGRNKLAKQMQEIASFASLDGKFTNSSGRKTVIQSLRDEFHPLEISELTGHADPGSISSYSHNPLEKQRQMSNKLAGFSSATTTSNANSASSPGSSTQVRAQVLREVNSSALQTTQENSTASVNNDGSNPAALTASALGGLFTGVTFNNSPLNISISFQSNVNPSSSL